MSRRVLKPDPIEKRIEAYKALSEDERQEAMWEALQTLREHGMRLGPKAEAYLERRSSIKRNIPKGNT